MSMPADNEEKVLNQEPTVLYEDESVLVAAKPASWLVHSDGRDTTSPTLVEWFLKRCPEAKGVGETTATQGGQTIERSGVVHRLDRDTSGVVILAKTPEAHAHIKAQFHDRLASKEYRAFVYGAVKLAPMTIDRPIGRSQRDFRLRSAQRGARGRLRDAVTVVECIGSGVADGETYSYLKLFPKTGRTHQLRVHLKAIDRPIVCDTLYAGKRVDAGHNLGFTRLALHAHILELTLPNGSRERFIAPLPQSFEEAAERIAE